MSNRFFTQSLLLRRQIMFSPISVAIHGTLLCYYFHKVIWFCFTSIVELNLTQLGCWIKLCMKLKSRNLLYFLQIMLSDILYFNSNFLQDPDRILHTPDKVIVHEVYAWFSAQFLIKHISSSLWHDSGLGSDSDADTDINIWVLRIW